MATSLIKPAVLAKLLALLNERHGASLRGERFTAEASRVGGDVIAKVELASPDRTFVYVMEAAIVRANYTDMSVGDAIDVALDFLDWYLGEFFESHRELLLPLDWQAHRFGDVEVMARGDLRNEFLDSAADAWLRGERPDVEGQWRALKGSKR